MPLIYADTSALFAFFHPRDEFAEPVTVAARKVAPDFVYWSFLRYELRHNLRQTRGDSRILPSAWRSAENALFGVMRLLQASQPLSSATSFIKE